MPILPLTDTGPTPHRPQPSPLRQANLDQRARVGLAGLRDGVEHAWQLRGHHSTCTHHTQACIYCRAAHVDGIPDAVLLPSLGVVRHYSFLNSPAFCESAVAGNLLFVWASYLVFMGETMSKDPKPGMKRVGRIVTGFGSLGKASGDFCLPRIPRRIPEPGGHLRGREAHGRFHLQQWDPSEYKDELVRIPHNELTLPPCQSGHGGPQQRGRDRKARGRSAGASGNRP